MDINIFLFKNVLKLFLPVVDVSYCSDDFKLYLGDYITCKYVKAANHYRIFCVWCKLQLQVKPGEASGNYHMAKLTTWSPFTS